MMKYSLDLRKSVAPPGHVWVASGRGTVAPAEGTVCGVRGFFSPPVAAPDASMLFTMVADGHRIPDCGSRGKEDVGLLFSGATWHPHCIARRGTYHWKCGDRLLSLAVESKLAAASSAAGFEVEVSVRNRGAGPVSVRIECRADPGRPRIVPPGPGWNFTPPPPADEPPIPAGNGVWRTGGGLRCVLSGDLDSEKTLLPDEPGRWRFSFQFGTSGAADGTAGDCGHAFPCGMIEEAEGAWRRRIRAAEEALPAIQTDVPGLEAYWNRSLLSGLVSLWECPGFAVNPFPATSGIDGGSICCYPWDAAGYGARFLAMLLGDRCPDLLKALLRSGIDRHICMAPDGSGQGDCPYSYSLWSVVNLYWHILCATGTGGELFGDVLEVFMADERRLPDFGELKDYGAQRNLLEMRTCGYEHVAPSPNAERAWAFDRLADIAERIGAGGAAEWRAKAARIREAIRRELWNPGIGWFDCIHPGGRRETVYSIQAYDALRFGACTPAMKDALLSHLRNGAFLGRFGVSSVSAEDTIHYELNDPDWSGGGAYAGEGPQLAETLWRCGEGDKAMDVLSRHFWMGEMLPYFPQEHYCDRPAVPAHKRANIIAGVAGFEAVLFGLAGFEPQLDGTLRIAPCNLAQGFVEIVNFRHRGRKIGLRLGGGRMRVTIDGAAVHDGKTTTLAV